MGSGQRDYTIFIGEDVIAHKTDHQKGGLDEVEITNLSGKAADFQKADNVKADEAATRPTTPATGDIFFSTDSKRLSIGYEASPGQWYNFDPVDDTDTDTVKNKLVSNALAKSWTDGAAAIAAGLIVMWHGLLANIPTGWVLCDGANSTPDLRGKFVYGAAASVEPGGTGGATTHTHAAGSYAGPSHTHTGPSHSHGAGTYAINVGGYAIGCAANGQQVVGDSGQDYSVAGISAAGGTDATGAGGTGAITGISATGSSLPPYYKVAFIMKT